MEKDIGKIGKSSAVDIVIRIDDFGGKTGLTIREFAKGTDGGYSGFTKSGTRIPADKFLEFRELVNSINLADLSTAENAGPTQAKSKPKTEDDASVEDY